MLKKASKSTSRLNYLMNGLWEGEVTLFLTFFQFIGIRLFLAVFVYLHHFIPSIQIALFICFIQFLCVLFHIFWYYDQHLLFIQIILVREINLLVCAVIQTIVLIKDDTNKLFGIIIASMNMGLAFLLTIMIIITSIFFSWPVVWLFSKFYWWTDFQRSTFHNWLTVVTTSQVTAPENYIPS